MSINQSQPRMRLHPILLHNRFHRKPAASLVFGLFGARVLAARLAGYTRSALHPCTSGLVPNKISGMGTNFGLLVHLLPGPNKQRALKPSILLS